MTDRLYLCVHIPHMTKGEKTKQFIIEKSAPIFNVKGLAGTAMSDIMEATNLAKGTIYIHFKDKEELSGCVVDYNLKTLVDRILAYANKQQTAKQKLLSFLDFLGDPLNPPIIGGCPMINFGMEADDTNPAIHKKVNKVVEAVHLSISSLVEMGIKGGEFNKKWDAKVFAIKMFALIEGGIMVSRISGDTSKMKVIVNIIKNEIEGNTL